MGAVTSMTFNWSAIVALGAILVNVAMAGFTAWMARSTQKMAEATRATVAAEHSAIEQAKDALMPVVAIEWSIHYSAEAASSPQTFQLTLHNYGTGPAFIREVTARNEVSVSALYHSPVRTTVLQTGTQFVGELEGELTTSVGFAEEISSVSIWYTDVYDRWFRSRIVVQYPRRTPTDAWIKTPVLAREFLKNIPQPSMSYGDIHNRYPQNYVGHFELGRFIPASELTAEWYTLETRQKIQRLRINGTATTHNQPLLITDISYWVKTPYPAFTLQIGQHPSFVLGLDRHEFNDNMAEEPFVLTEEDYASKRFELPSIVANVDKVPLEQWGLKNTNRAVQDMTDLYRHVWNQIKAKTMPLEDDASDKLVERQEPK